MEQQRFTTQRCVRESVNKNVHAVVPFSFFLKSLLTGVLQVLDVFHLPISC